MASQIHGYKCAVWLRHHNRIILGWYVVTHHRSVVVETGTTLPWRAEVKGLVVGQTADVARRSLVSYNIRRNCCVSCAVTRG